MLSARRVTSRSSEFRLSFGAAGRGFSTVQRQPVDGEGVEQHFGADPSGRRQHVPQHFFDPIGMSFAWATPAAGTMLAREITAISATQRQDFAEKRTISTPV
jgi:hypothetical protein